MIIDKILLGIGIILMFLGFLLMIEARTIRKNGKEFTHTHGVTKPEVNMWGWIFFIGGVIFQCASLFSSLCFGVAGMALVVAIFIYKNIRKRMLKKGGESKENGFY